MVTVGDCEALCMNLVLHLGVCVRVVMYGCTTVGTTCMCACTSIHPMVVKLKNIIKRHEEKNKNIQKYKQKTTQSNYHRILYILFYHIEADCNFDVDLYLYITRRQPLCRDQSQRMQRKGKQYKQTKKTKKKVFIF